MGRVRKGNKERISDKRVRSKSAIVLPSETRISPAQPDKPPHTVTPSFIDSVKKGPTITPQMRRVAIATYFLEAMDAPSPNEDGETTKWIAKEFQISRGSNKWIGDVISEVRECAKAGVEYSGDRKCTARPTLHSISLDSPAARIIAEAMVDGCSIRRAHADVMDWLRRRYDKGESNVKW